MTFVILIVYMTLKPKYSSAGKWYWWVGLTYFIFIQITYLVCITRFFLGIDFQFIAIIELRFWPQGSLKLNLLILFSEKEFATTLKGL